MNINEKILTGVKVLELSTFVAAPGCAKVLADWGADVIKVEPRFGDLWRVQGRALGMPISPDENPCFDVENGNKRGVSIDLKSEEGLNILYKLLEQCDVMITNYREAALKKLGLTYDELSQKFPGLVYGQILGFGEKGPEKDRPGFDITAYLARSGVMSQLGEPDASPLNIISSFGDHQAGMNLVGGICGALYKKQRTGKGEKVSVSLYHTAIYALSTMIASAQYGVLNYPVSRKKPPTALANTYKCKDGRWLVLVCPAPDVQWPILCKAMEREDLADVEKYRSLANIIKYSEEIVTILEEEFAKRDIEEWRRILNAYDIPFEKLQNWNEVLEDEQAWANDCFYKTTYSNGNTSILPTSPVKFEKMGLPEFNMGPQLGEHTVEVLSELGFSSDEIQDMKARKIIKTVKSPECSCS